MCQGVCLVMRKHAVNMHSLGGTATFGPREPGSRGGYAKSSVHLFQIASNGFAKLAHWYQKWIFIGKSSGC